MDNRCVGLQFTACPIHHPTTLTMSQQWFWFFGGGACFQVEDDSLFDENGEVRETGHIDEATGEMVRPWCPATRLLDHMENVS